MSEHPWDYAPDIKPGSKIAYKRGDEIWTQTVESVTHSTQPYVPAPPLPRWRRIARWLTPRRWRKPLPQPSGGMPVVTIKTTDPFWSRETGNSTTPPGGIDLTDEEYEEFIKAARS